MSVALTVIFSIFLIFHGLMLLFFVKMLVTKEMSILNKTHLSLSFATILPLFVGDILVLASLGGRFEMKNYFLSALTDYCAGVMYQTIFQHFFQYRSSLLYKGIAQKFYDFVIFSIILKALFTQIFSTLGFVVSQIWGLSIQSYGTIFQIVVSFTNLLFNTMLMQKLMSIDIKYSRRGSWNSRRSVSIINKSFIDRSSSNESRVALRSSSSSADNIFTRVKEDIHKSIVRTLVSGVIFVLLAVILLSIYSDNSPRSAYFISISYRFALVPAVLMTTIPIWKTIKEKSVDRKWLKKAVSSSPGKSYEAKDFSDGVGVAVIAALENDSENCP